MDYSALVLSINIYIENHICESIDYSVLERKTGFSIAHLRDVFKTKTGKSLASYITERKIKNSAFDIIHTDKTILEIALKYGFNNHDTFTRAFKRITAVNPNEFRKKRFCAGSNLITDGFYAVDTVCATTKEKYYMDKFKSKDSTVLYGIPKVAFGCESGNTPLITCVKSCLTYLGDDIDYDYVYAVSGGAFRLTWNTSCAFLGNVDICFTFDDESRVYTDIFKGLGREVEILGRDKSSTKAEFIEFIKSNIDAGFPCLAQGIVGPPEVCIISGYRNNGETLLGWSYFQDGNAFGDVSTQIDESGYYICDTWWENDATQSAFRVGNKTGEPYGLKQVIEVAIEVLDGHNCGDFAKGLFAYDAWRNTINNDKDFSNDTVIQNLTDMILCQIDAMTCICDGRNSAARYFMSCSEKYPEHKDMLSEIAQLFWSTTSHVSKMADYIGGWGCEQENIDMFKDLSNRKEICKLIESAKNSDSKALELMKKLSTIL